METATYRLPRPIFAQTLLLDLGLPLVDDGLEVRQRTAYRPLDSARPGRNESANEPSAVAVAPFEGTSACLPLQGVGEEVEKEPIEDYVRRDRDREVEVLLVATYEALVETPSRLNGR